MQIYTCFLTDEEDGLRLPVLAPSAEIAALLYAKEVAPALFAEGPSPAFDAFLRTIVALPGGEEEKERRLAERRLRSSIHLVKGRSVKEDDD